MGVLNISKKVVWGFFNGACQGDKHMTCGIGFEIFLSEVNFYCGKYHVGNITNNKEEFLSLVYLLKTTIEIGLGKLQVF